MRRTHLGKERRSGFKIAVVADDAGGLQTAEFLLGEQTEGGAEFDARDFAVRCGEGMNLPQFACGELASAGDVGKS